MIKSQVGTVVASMRGTFTSSDIAALTETTFAVGQITKVLRGMSGVVEVSKGVFKAKGRAVPSTPR